MNRTTLLFLGVFLTTAALIAAQSRTAKAPESLPHPVLAVAGGAPGHYIGVASCVNSGCHGATHPLNANRVLQNEYYTWLNRDRHARAYNILYNERSARIAKNMRLKQAAYKEAVCLNCHATNVGAADVSGHIDIEDGIQCESCHGPASGWLGEHMMAGWTHEQSVARGMYDLRAALSRATVCLSCHLGNAHQEVDHELIASGHPILAFELDNYTETMPPHWKPGSSTHGAVAWATGPAVALRDSLDNLARHAQGKRWPEFSDMSCFNCHHSLTTSTWRQERGWPDRAGLPSWSPQHWGVFRLIVERADPAVREQLDKRLREVASRVAMMGDREGVTTSARETSAMVTSLIPRITKLSWNDADVRDMMRRLAQGDQWTLYDVHSAEQTALALQSLAAARTRNNPQLLHGPMTKALDDLFAAVHDRDAYDPKRFTEKLAKLRATI